MLLDNISLKLPHLISKAFLANRFLFFDDDYLDNRIYKPEEHICVDIGIYKSDLKNIQEKEIVLRKIRLNIKPLSRKNHPHKGHELAIGDRSSIILRLHEIIFGGTEISINLYDFANPEGQK